MRAADAALALLVFLASALLTGGVRRYSLARRLLDHPNERSSHRVPTPRGGGLAIVAAFLTALTYGAWDGGSLLNPLFLALVPVGLLVAGIGWIDDQGHVPARIRASVHVGASALAVWLLSGTGTGLLGLGMLGYTLFGQVLAVIGIAWLLNLYNFMDGIDGLAGVEALCAGVTATALCWAAGAPNLAFVALALTAASAGFLVWNWPVAKIFMGDVGSGYIGFAFGVLTYTSARQGVLSVWVWMILLGVFIVDATVTLSRRVLRGARWYEAHRSHAYQHAARRWDSHRKVTVAVTLINFLWLAPWAWVAYRWPPWGPLAAAVSLSPLAAAVVLLGAGTASGGIPRGAEKLPKS